MSSVNQSHIIGQQHYHIELADQTEAHPVSDRISSIQATHIQPVIERVLEKYHDVHSIYQFNEIVVDLGKVSRNNLGSEIALRLEEELTRFFQRSISDSGHLRTGRKRKTNHHLLEQFEHFLMHGNVKRDSLAQNNPVQLLRTLLANQLEDTVLMLKDLGRQTKVRSRLILTYKEPELELVVQKVLPSESDYIVAYKNTILTQFESGNTEASTYTNFRHAIWEVILSYLFERRSNYHSRKVFLRFLINQIGIRYNIDYQYFLQLIVDGLSTQSVLLRKEDFSRIVMELSAEEAQKSEEQQSIKHQRLINFESVLRSCIEKRKLSVKSFTTISNSEFEQNFLQWLDANSVTSLKWFREALTTKAQFDVLQPLFLEHVLEAIQRKFHFKSVAVLLDVFEVWNKRGSALSPNAHRSVSYLYSKRYFYAFLLQAQSNSSARTKLYGAFLKEIWQTGLVNTSQLFEVLLAVRQDASTDNYVVIMKQFSSLLRTLEWSQLNVSRKSLERILSTRSGEISMQEIQNWLKKYDTGSAINEVNLKYNLMMYLYAELDQRGVKVRTITELGNQIRKLKQSRVQIDSFNQTVYRLKTTDLPPDYQARVEFINNVLSHFIELLRSKENVQYKIQQAQAYIIRVSLNAELDLAKILRLVLSRHRSHLQLRQELSLIKRILDTMSQRPIPPQEIMEVVAYVLEKGSLPWWSQTYSWSQFRFDFEQLWSLPAYRKPLIRAMRKSTVRHRWVMQLGEHMSKQVWQALDLSSHKYITSFFKGITENALFSVSALAEDKSLFYGDLWEVLLQKSASKQEGAFYSWFTKWVVEAPSYKRYLPESFFTELKKVVDSMRPMYKSKVLNWLNNRNISSEDRWGAIQTEKDYVQAIPEVYRISNHVSFQLLSIMPKTTLVHHASYANIRSIWIRRMKDSDLERTILQLQANTQKRQEVLEILEQFASIKSFLPGKLWSELHKSLIEQLLIATSAGLMSSMASSVWYIYVLNRLKTMLTFKDFISFLDAYAVTGKRDDKSYILRSLALNWYSKWIRNEDTLMSESESRPKSATVDTTKEMATPEEENEYMRLGEEEAFSFTDPQLVNQSGLVLLAPFLGMLFERTGLIAENAFIHDEARYRAVHLLEYAATGANLTEGAGILLHKILVGLPPNGIVDRHLTLTDSEKSMVDGMLRAVLQQVKSFGGTSIDGFRQSFIQRAGQIQEQDNRYYLRVESQSFDMLLDQIPWNIAQIKLSWMDKLIFVEWRN